MAPSAGVSSATVALYDDEGQLVEWQLVGRDVTERHHLEAELARPRSSSRTCTTTRPVATTRWTARASTCT